MSADLSKSKGGCNPWFIAMLISAGVSAAIFYGQYKHKQGVMEGACRWELIGNEEAYPREGYYTCHIYLHKGLPTDVHLTFNRPKEE